MNRGLRLFGHPLHAILSDLPVGLLGTSLVWDIVGMVRHEGFWWGIAFWSICLGLASAAAAAVAGLIDYAAIPEGSSALPTAMRHMITMGCMLIPYVASLLFRGGPGAPTGHFVYVILGLEALGVALLSLGGWFGGHLVFHYGIGRH